MLWHTFFFFFFLFAKKMLANAGYQKVVKKN
jgi:hypothetical protein